jgi:hypothetical protein
MALITNIERAAEADNSYTLAITTPGRLLWGHVEYTSNATAGNRQIRIAMLNAADNVLADSHAGAAQGASLVRHYMFLQGIYRETAFTDAEIDVPIPIGWYFLVGYSLRINDSAAIAAGDSMVISLSFTPGV